jgi:hypothetical protein
MYGQQPTSGQTQTGASTSAFVVTLFLWSSCLLLGGCVSTAVGVVAGATVAVGTAVVTAPVKVGAAVVDAVSDDDEDED